MGMTIYVPSLALNAVTPLSLSTTIIISSLACTFYTALVRSALIHALHNIPTKRYHTNASSRFYAKINQHFQNFFAEISLVKYQFIKRFLLCFLVQISQYPSARAPFPSIIYSFLTLIKMHDYIGLNKYSSL